MPVSSPGYNERSWAIDVISEINGYCAPRSRAIARAGGEYTVSGQKSSLFPDVLLFGDQSSSVVLQGWELKMPGTAINDQELLENAKQKAHRLNLNSFLVWNANEAMLYLRDAKDDFVHTKAWAPTNILRRADVAGNRVAWVSLLHQIIDDLNDLFDKGTIKGVSPITAISDALFVEYLKQYAPALADAIKSATQTDAIFSAELTVWWVANKVEHPGLNEYEGMARVTLINWINKFLFAHYLKRFQNAAKAVESFNATTTVDDAIIWFNGLSASCDFMNVFQATLGEATLDANTWSGLLNLNTLLTAFNLDSISQASFQQVLDNALNYSRKKLAGQYSTPRPLADLLVRLAVKDRTKPIFDPCCGTGTVARAAYDLKTSVGVSVPTALHEVWASDRFTFPLSLCSIALSDPLGMGEVVQVFQQDIFDLAVGQNISFIDPNTGGYVVRALPVMQTIVSNLPFVAFESTDKANPQLDGRADLYAKILLQLKTLVSENGSIGVVTSNSWLGTEWGTQFRKLLFESFKIKQIVISGQGRWFQNADVVTTLLILEKRNVTQTPLVNEETTFLTTTQPLDLWEAQPGGIDRMTSYMLARSGSHSGFTQSVYQKQQIHNMEAVGIGWNALFADVSWVDQIAGHLIPVHKFFSINRGERRGWDRLFYPKKGHGIEPQYIRPVLLSSQDTPSLLAAADGDAFCCSDTIADLKTKRMTGALAWITRFEKATNGTNKPLPSVLARTGYKWYEMRPNTLADFVVSVAPDQRLCVHRFMQPTFVNQRLTRITSKPNVSADVELCHALMNSVIGMFLIEALGFGRGLGVLDLNSTKLSKQWHLLNPAVVTPNDRTKILVAFQPLLSRNVLRLPDELQSPDRMNFDSMVLAAFGIAPLQKAIYSTLEILFNIRQTART